MPDHGCTPLPFPSRSARTAVSRNHREVPLADLELVREMARGNARAMAMLYDRFCGTLLVVARRMLRDPALAEDLVHDVFLDAWRRADSFDPTRGGLRTWLLVRLRSRAQDRLRSAYARREIPSALVGDAPAPEGEAPIVILDRRRVGILLGRLPAEQRQVLELTYVRGLTAPEVAVHMRSALGTVKSRTAAGLAKLRSAITTKQS